MNEMPSRVELVTEIHRLREQLEEAEETLAAIRTGSVDALVMDGPDGKQVYTLQGADHAFRLFIESMNEGAMTMTADGFIVYANRRFADLIGCPLESVLGSDVHQFVPALERSVFERLMQSCHSKPGRQELSLAHKEGALIPVQVSAQHLPMQSGNFYCLVVTDLREQLVQEKLKVSEARYRSLVERMPAAMYTIDREGRITFYNDQAADLWGRRPRLGDEEARFCGSYKLWLPDGTPLPHDKTLMVDAVRDGKSFYGQEVIIERLDGSRRHIIVHIDPLRDAEGHIVGAVNLLMDITGRRQAEESLAEQKRLYQSVTDNASMALFILDERQYCVFMNPAAEQLTGYRYSETQNRPLHEVVHHTRPDGRPYPLSECPIDQAFPGRNKMQGEEIFVHKDGHFYHVAFTASPLPDEAGQPVGTVVEVQDITEHKQAEQALRVSEQRLQRVLETEAVGVLFFDHSGTVVQANHVFLRMTGYRREQIERRELTWRTMTPPEWIEASEAQMERLARTGRIGPYEREYRYADGSRRWMLFAGRDLGDGTIVEYAVDIHDRKQAEQALREAQERLQRWNVELEQAVNAKTAELRHSHERLRAMASELNLAEQRERKRLATELHDHLQQMLVVGKLEVGRGRRVLGLVPDCETALKRVDDILSDALTYSRTLVAELSPPVLHDHGLGAGLRWLADYMSKKHGQTVTVVVSEENGLKLPEDQRVLLFQSVRELLINASKHADTGSATVEMIERADQVQIQVRDEGHGFDLAAAAVTSNGGISSKFGLFSIRERMRALGGAFHLHSEPGKGTTATLVLPLLRRDVREARDKRDEQTPASKPGSPLSPVAPIDRIRVLLVDDHIMVRQGLRAVLESYADIELIGEASDGEAAVTMVDQRHPDVVVMDISMPGMNGIDATTRIKRRHPRTIIIGLSINAAGENQELMTRAGAACLITKETAVEHLYDVILETRNKSVREEIPPA
jgi:PAS domain S-box-containing protein